MEDGDTGRKRRKLGAALAAVLVCALIVATATGWWASSEGRDAWVPGFDLSIEATEDLIRSWGGWGVAGSIALMVIHSFVPFPAEILAIANGMVYGPFWGTAITWTGAMLGAYLAFGLARWFGQPAVRMLVSEARWRQIEAWSSEQGGAVLLISRLIPVIAFNLINYAAGLTNISWWTFTWATGLGILPLTVLMAILGDNMAMIPWWLWPLLAFAALALWLVFRHRRRQAAPRPQADSAGSDE